MVNLYYEIGAYYSNGGLKAFYRRLPDDESLTSLAYAAGYFDQSHFIKDFKSFTGQTPGHFFAHKDWW